MPVITETQYFIESEKENSNTINENLKETLQKYTTHFPQPDVPIEPLYPAEIKNRNRTPPNTISSRVKNEESRIQSPLEIIGITTGQLTKTEFRPSQNSFQIINPDTLVINPKPNAIVKPVRRNVLSMNGNYTVNTGNYDKKIINSNNHNNNNNNKKQMKNEDDEKVDGVGLELNGINNKNLRYDHIYGSLDYNSIEGMGGGGVGDTHTVAGSTKKPEKKIGFFSEMANFAKELNQKLHRLKNVKTSPTRSTSKNSTQQNNDVPNKRPLFITTVPSGVFLPPMKVTSPTLPKRVYAYSSHPKIFTIYRSDQNPTASGYYTKERNDNDTKDQENNESKENNDENSEKAKASLNERMKRDVFRGSDYIRPYNFYRNDMSKSSLNDSNKSLDKKDQTREPVPPQPFKNIMHDKRVVRGTNFSQVQCQPWNPYFSHAGVLSGKDQSIQSKEQEAKRRLLLRKRCLARNQRNIIGSPPPIQGRVHIPIQTDKYLEELFDRPPEYDANTQTDLFLQRPPSPPYVPAKVGIDCATQIEEGELFDFDAEAQPILDTLIGHSVQQSLMETLHEQEMAELKSKQEELLARREAELAELRRLEEEDRRLREEKERRAKQYEIANELDVKHQEQVTAAKLLQGHIASILPEVLQKLEPQTDFANKDELEQKICPWLSKEVAEEVGKMIDSREILTEIIKEIIIQRAQAYAGYTETTETETEDEKIDEEEVCYEDEEFIRDEISQMIDSLEDREIGGQDVTCLETIEEEIIKEDFYNLTQAKENEEGLNKIEEIIQNVLVEDQSLDDNNVEAIVKEEVMDIIEKAELSEPQYNDENTESTVIDKVLPENINDLNIENDLPQYNEKLINTEIVSAPVEDNDEDSQTDSSSDVDDIVRDEVERIFSLTSTEDSADLITQIENIDNMTSSQSNNENLKIVGEDDTVDIDYDNDNNDINDDKTDNDDNDDSGEESDEEFLRNQVQKMISSAEDISLKQNSDDIDLSYVS